MKLLEATLASTPSARPIPTEQARQGPCLDRGYDYQAVRELAVAQRLVPHIRTRGEELAEKVRDPSWRARRWVVEAAHSWLNRNRAILIRWSKKDENHLALLQLASGLIALVCKSAGWPRDNAPP
jgi:putative transposase